MLGTAAPASSQRPSAEPLRLDAGDEIRIDGDLSDAPWARAVPLSPLVQVEPREGVPPTWPTELRIAYDQDFFYLAIRCFDDPDEVRARQRDRDAFVRYDDVCEWWIDTFHDRRFAFWFQATPAGSLGDALIADGGESFNKNWDGIWYGEVRRTGDGWQAEVAIPFQTLVFEEGESTWGFNLVRKRVANGEEDRWASPTIAYDFFQLSEGGVLTGLAGMRQGLGVDVVPYGKVTARRDDASDDSDLLGDAGVDVVWRVDPQTTLRATVNTDFAETEVDARRVNLTRFPLFFPEKRDFFLEDAGLFEFGPSGGAGDSPEVLPFFSRRIGRDEEGEAIPILAGLKFTGRIDGWNIGVLDTLVDGHDDLDETNLGVVRVSRNIGVQSALGMIFTSGRPDAEGSAYTGGVDMRLGSPRAFGEGRSGDFWAWWLTTAADGPDGEGDAFGLRGRMQTRSWDHDASVQSIGSGFDPELGFVQRTGITTWAWASRYEWRSQGEGVIRQVDAGISPSYTTDLSGDLDSWSVPLEWLDLQFASEDGIGFTTTRSFERIDEDFTLSDDTTVTADDYDMLRHELELVTNDRRVLNGAAGVEFGDFYGGDLTRFAIAPVLIPGPLLTLSVEYEDIEVELEDSGFHTKLVGVHADFSFDPELSWKNFVQYDTDSRNLGAQSRLHWIIEPGKDLFFVAQLGWESEASGEPLVPTGQDAAIKVAYTMRF